MKPQTDRQRIESMVGALERITDATDAQTDQALNAARRNALRESGAKRTKNWLMTLASAVVLVLVVGVFTAGRNGSEVSAMTEQLVADAELYQEMEFYLWLSEELELE